MSELPDEVVLFVFGEYKHFDDDWRPCRYINLPDDASEVPVLAKGGWFLWDADDVRPVNTPNGE